MSIQLPVSADKRVDAPATQERARQTRLKLIEAAIQLLASHGYAATTMARIAKAASVSAGPRQYHFPRPVDLFAAVVAHIHEKQLGRVMMADLPPKGQDRIARQFQAAIRNAGSVEHIAMLELKMAMRGDPELQMAVGPKIRAFEDRADQGFLGVFGDRGLTDAELIAIRGIMAATLRGIAIAGLERDQTDVKDEIGRLLPRMIGLLAADRKASQET
jgi:AcrR family transcriptional regulator